MLLRHKPVDRPPVVARARPTGTDRRRVGRASSGARVFLAGVLVGAIIWRVTLKSAATEVAQGVGGFSAPQFPAAGAGEVRAVATRESSKAEFKVSPRSTGAPAPARAKLFVPQASYKYSECERRSLGWAKYRAWAKGRKEVVCKGYSTVWCITFPYHNPPRAFFCYGSNIIETRDGEGVYWTAYCEKTPVWTRSGFFDELGKSAPLIREPGRAGTLRVAPDGEQPRSGLTALPRRASLTYVAMTDCHNRNPAHCQAGPQLGYLIRELLGASREESRLVMSEPMQNEPYGWCAVFGTCRMSLAEAARGGGQGSGGAGDHQGSTGNSRVLLDTVAFSPEPMYAPHWQGNRDDRACEGRSDFLRDFQGSLIAQVTASLAQQYPGIAPPPGGDLCAWLAGPEFKRKDGDDVHRRVIGLEKCADRRAGGKGILLVLTRRGPAFRKRGERRYIENLDAIVEALARATDRTIVVVNPGREHYLVQMALPSAADVVLGMHGGGLWGAVRWMGPGQAMVEVLPIRGPGDTCLKAKGFGAQYFALVCTACTGSGRHHGSINPDQVTQAVSVVLGALDRERTGEKFGLQSTKCSMIPRLTNGAMSAKYKLYSQQGKAIPLQVGM